MKLNPLPGTDLKISEISWGAGTAAGLMVTGERSAQIDAVERALEAGINHFDTAPLYGFGASETNLGASLRAVGADVLITTKFNVPAEYVSQGTIAGRVRQSVNESLQRLQRDHIDILLIHNATHLKRDLNAVSNPGLALVSNILPHVSIDDIFGKGGVWEAVEDIKKAGKVRYFGISGQDNNAAAVKAVIGTGRINVFNQPFNLLNPSAAFPAARRGKPTPNGFSAEQADFVDFQDVVEFARHNNVGASVISPVAAGALTEEALNGEPAPAVSDRAPRFPRAGQYERELALARRFVPVARRFGLSITELAYRFALSAPGVVTVLGGFSSTAQMRQAVDAAKRGPLEDEVISAIHDVWFPAAP